MSSAWFAISHFDHTLDCGFGNLSQSCLRPRLRADWQVKWQSSLVDQWVRYAFSCPHACPLACTARPHHCLQVGSPGLEPRSCRSDSSGYMCGNYIYIYIYISLSHTQSKPLRFTSVTIILELMHPTFELGLWCACVQALAKPP